VRARKYLSQTREHGICVALDASAASRARDERNDFTGRGKGRRMQGTLGWPLQRAARLRGDEIAVIDGRRQLTYRQLYDRVRRIGTGLAENKIGPGAVVAVLLQNSLEHLEAWLSVPSYGRVLTSLNTRLAVSELAYVLQDSGAEVLIVDEANLDAGRHLRQLAPRVKSLLFAGDGACPDDCLPYGSLLGADGTPMPDDLDPLSVAVVMYTGGTTGRPKGVMLSHANLLANSKHMLYITGVQPEDRMLYSAPIFHIAAGQLVHPVTWVGGTHVMSPRFTPAEFVRAVVEHQATASIVVPTMIHMLLEHLDEQPADMSSLRQLHYGASPIAPKLLRRASAALGCEFLQGYGMTEAGAGVTFLSPQDHRRALAGKFEERLKSVGYPMPGVQLEVRDEDGRAVPDGTVGEVWVRGPNIMLGYLNRAEETSRALVDGWYRTGDGGYCDAEGYLFLVDRLKDMIISGGENVYSLEVEQVLLTHPDVAEAAVVGIPDDRWGERVHAVVVTGTDSSVSEAELIEHCRKHIASYKVPKTMMFQTEPLPKSGPGKVLKHEVREAVRLTERHSSATAL
jgi:long-chain acyl-CoA synthetase